jgi:hypothetical protein
MPLTPGTDPSQFGEVAHFPEMGALFKQCVSDVLRAEPDLHVDSAQQACREILHLPWYYQTPWEPPINWLYRNSLLVTLLIAALLVLVAGWKFRLILAKAPDLVGRTVYALTGYRWADVARRWRGFKN